jgi:hypothetical protein
MRKVLSPISEKRISRIDWVNVSKGDGPPDGGGSEDVADMVVGAEYVASPYGLT